MKEEEKMFDKVVAVFSKHYNLNLILNMTNFIIIYYNLYVRMRDDQEEFQNFVI